MKTSFKFFILLLLLSVGCAKEVILTDETLPDEIFYVEGTNKPYTGKCVVYYKNTKDLHYTFTFENGILNGAFKSYFRNGKVEYSANYYDGELAGNLTKYQENGAVELTCDMTNQSQRSR